jgi:hypothetical protein
MSLSSLSFESFRSLSLSLFLLKKIVAAAAAAAAAVVVIGQ